MFGIVRYTDNTMNDFIIEYKSNNFRELLELLNTLRLKYYTKENKPIFRIVRL